MILITGANGNVGNEVLKQIAQTGAEVRAAFQSVSKAVETPTGVEIVSLDYNQAETLQTALKGTRKRGIRRVAVRDESVIGHRPAPQLRPPAPRLRSDHRRPLRLSSSTMAKMFGRAPSVGSAMAKPGRVTAKRLPG